MKFKKLVQNLMFHVGSRLPTKPIVVEDDYSFKHKIHEI